MTTASPWRLQAPASPPLSPRFGSAAGQVATGFGRKLLNHLDFREMGTSQVNQIQVIYLACILWRLVAANERRKDTPNQSWNEIRESLLRDSIGYTFWFFGTPLLQRMYLKHCVPAEIQSALVQKAPAAPLKNGKQTLWGWLKANNPITGLNIPTSQQVKDQWEQARQALTRKGVGITEHAYLQQEKKFAQLLKHRNLATALGLGFTIALLGIGINLINIYMTRQNQKQHQQNQPDFPAAPALPRVTPPATALQPPPVPSLAVPPLRPTSPTFNAAQRPLSPFPLTGYGQPRPGYAPFPWR